MGVCNEMEEKMDSLQWDVLENIVSGNGGVSSVVWESFDYKMTKQIARFLGEKVLPGTVISLIGDLGVGKTVRGYSKQMVQNKLKQMRRQAAK